MTYDFIELNKLGQMLKVQGENLRAHLHTDENEAAYRMDPFGFLVRTQGDILERLSNTLSSVLHSSVPAVIVHGSGAIAELMQKNDLRPRPPTDIDLVIITPDGHADGSLDEAIKKFANALSSPAIGVHSGHYTFHYPLRRRNNLPSNVFFAHPLDIAMGKCRRLARLGLDSRIKDAPLSISKDILDLIYLDKVCNGFSPTFWARVVTDCTSENPNWVDHPNIFSPIKSLLKNDGEILLPHLESPEQLHQTAKFTDSWHSDLDGYLQDQRWLDQLRRLNEEHRVAPRAGRFKRRQLTSAQLESITESKSVLR